MTVAPGKRLIFDYYALPTQKDDHHQCLGSRTPATFARAMRPSRAVNIGAQQLPFARAFVPTNGAGKTPH